MGEGVGAMSGVEALARHAGPTQNLLIRYWENECVSLSDAFDGGFIAANTVAILFNWLMLLVGFLVETQRIEPVYEQTVIVSGFAPLTIAFIPSGLLLGSYFTVHGLVVVLATLFVWCAPARTPNPKPPDRNPAYPITRGLYGVVSLQYVDQTEKKARFFNVLDVSLPRHAPSQHCALCNHPCSLP